MKTDEALKALGDKDFLDKIYRFSYYRCDTSFEAEDLCSDIILAVISAIHKQERIENFYAFVWTIAHRVYADYSRERNSERRILGFEDSDILLEAKDNEIDNLIEEAAEREQISRIFKEITFLAGMYREVMVMFYIDGLKVKEIAARLDISENNVKQRLFSARNSIRKEVGTMSERNYILKPVKLAFMGTGSPVGNDPRIKAERMFSQNLVYLCKDRPKSAKELSDELCMPMPYVEEELDIQCHGENGTYGLLRRLENGKYALNILLADYDEYDKANLISERHLPEFCGIVKNIIRKNKEKLLSFPYLSSQTDVGFIMWSLISRTCWILNGKINDILNDKYFSDIVPVERNFSTVAIAYTDEQQPDFSFYGCDEINAEAVGGYKQVLVSNIYGKHIEEHFNCRHNIANDPKLLMTLMSIGGISIDELSENEKEIAAKALECGYLRKKGNMIEPKIIVIDIKDKMDFYDLSYDINSSEMDELAGKIAAELSDFMRSRIPEHLMNEYRIYMELIAGTRMLSRTIDECISEGVLSKPENRLGAEGVLMVVEGSEK